MNSLHNFESEEYEWMDPESEIGFSVDYYTSYKLAKPLRLALNPASGLELLDARVALIFRQCWEYDDMHGNPRYNYSLIREEPGVYRTPYVPLGCMEDFSMFIHSREYSTPNPCFAPVQLHLMAKLRPEGGGEDASFAALYSIAIEGAPYSYDNTPPNPYAYVPETRTIQNITNIDPGFSLTAWGEITVLNDWNVEQEPVIRPFKFSDFRPIPATGTIPAPFTIIATPACPGNDPVDAQFLASFCQDRDKYNPVITLSPISEPDEFDLHEHGIGKLSKKNSVKVYPNPAGEEVNLVITANEPVSGDIEIFDVFGRSVHSRRNAINILTGNYTHTVPFSQFHPGMYIVQVRLSNGEVLEDRQGIAGVQNKFGGCSDWRNGDAGLTLGPNEMTA